MPMDQRLYVAAKEGDMKVLEEYKDQFATQLTPYNSTVLHVAAAVSCNRSSWKTHHLKDFFAMVDPDLLFSLNSAGDTFIHLATRETYVKFVQAFIDYSTMNCGINDIEADTHQLEACRDLLRISNNIGETALHVAVTHCLEAARLVSLLVKADPDFSHPPSKAGKSPLYLALDIQAIDLVELILNNSTSPSYAGPYGTTALHAVAMRDTGHLLEMILRKEPSLIEQVDDSGWSPLHFAAYVGSANVAKQLLLADKQMAYKTTEENNLTPLHIAAIRGELEVMEEILEQCPDSLEAVTSQDQNVLHLASAIGENSLRNMDEFLTNKKCSLRHLFSQRDTNGDLPCVVHRRNRGLLVLSHPCLKKLDVHHNVARFQETLRENRFNERKKEWKERANTHLIVATLITTISFAAGFTIPGGYDGDNDGPNKGMSILWKKKAFKAFAITDTIAMISSTSAVFLHYISTYEREERRLKRYKAAGVLALVAMISMMIAFMTGLYVVLPSPSLAVSVCVICSLSLAFFMHILAKTIIDSFSENRKRLELNRDSELVHYMFSS